MPLLEEQLPQVGHRLERVAARASAAPSPAVAWERLGARQPARVKVEHAQPVDGVERLDVLRPEGGAHAGQRLLEQRQRRVQVAQLLELRAQRAHRVERLRVLLAQQLAACGEVLLLQLARGRQVALLEEQPHEQVEGEARVRVPPAERLAPGDVRLLEEGARRRRVAGVVHSRPSGTISADSPRSSAGRLSSTSRPCAASQLRSSPITSRLTRANPPGSSRSSVSKRRSASSLGGEGPPTSTRDKAICMPPKSSRTAALNAACCSGGIARLSLPPLRAVWYSS